MTFRRSVLFIIIVLATAIVTPTFSQQIAPSQRGHYDFHPVRGFWNDYIENRLELGFHIIHHNLRDTSRPENRDETFLGYINRLESHDEPVFAPFVRYHVHDYVRVSLAYDRITARTRNFNNRLSDGNVVLSGPIFGVDVDYELPHGFTPYASIGYAFWSGSFDHDAWWTLGWSSPEAYEAAGRPNASQTGRRRFIRVQDERSLVWTVGCAYTFIDRFSLDVMARYVSVTTRAQAFFGPADNPAPGPAGSFPMSHYSIGLGATYTF